MKAALYIRVSTEEQAQHGYSLAAQEEKLSAYALSQDWEIVQVYRDEGRSAKDLKREQLQRMLTDLKDGLFDVVLVYRLDRLTRSVLDLYELLNIFDQYGVKFKSATEVYDTTTAIGRLFITLVAALAQWERENLAERVKFGMLKKASLGEWMGGIVPYGYTLEGSSFRIIKHEADIVKKIFKMAKSKGMDAISKSLNAENCRTRKGFNWSGFTVHYILRNPVYTGRFRYNEGSGKTDRPLEDQRIFESELIDPIVTENEFWEVQKILDARKSKKGKALTGKYYFTSVLLCGKCGASMTGTAYKYKEKNGETRVTKYYRCSNKIKSGDCAMPQIQESRLAEEIIRTFNDLTENWFSKPQAKQIADSNADRKAAARELDNVKKTINKYKLMFINDLIDMEELNNQLAALKIKQKNLEEGWSRVPDQDDTAKLSPGELENMIYHFKAVWDIADDEERKKLITSIFSEIVIDARVKSPCGPGTSKHFWIVSAK
ncbi:recombinase family protein [Domibacillus indicus]|uniref:recombinase family protein n=1 Tax=Domibacillus indicus TaxID=1437523 RepID=UPI0006991955|nr:recombinase family protein [Domibacillus indicus]